jgi:NADH-quinone oxidoreductase subunit J
LTVIPGFFVVFSRNIVHAGFSLLFTLLGVAGLYAILGADFLAVTQVVVYIGGILVLVMFTVMMTRIPIGVRRRGLDVHVPAGIFAVALFALIYKVITSTEWPLRSPEAAMATTAEIGTNFMTNYIFPFEYASLLLLVAMIGAAILIRERKLTPEDVNRLGAVALKPDDEAGPEATVADGSDSEEPGTAAAAAKATASAEPATPDTRGAIAAEEEQS